MPDGFELIHREIDVATQRREGLRLEYLHPRGSDEQWLVATGPVEFEKKTAWGHVKAGDLVLIPLVPYIIYTDPNLAASWLLAVGLKVGMEVQTRRGAFSLVMVTGRPLEDLAQEGHQGFMRIHVGFAIRTA